MTERERSHRQDGAEHEDVEEAPHAGARAIFVHALDAEIPLAGAGWPAGEFMQVGFRLVIAIDDARFGPLLDIEHELHRDAGLVRPSRTRRVLPVACKVAVCHQPSSNVVTPKMR